MIFGFAIITIQVSENRIGILSNKQITPIQFTHINTNDPQLIQKLHNHTQPLNQQSRNRLLPIITIITLITLCGLSHLVY